MLPEVNLNIFYCLNNDKKDQPQVFQLSIVFSMRLKRPKQFIHLMDISIDFGHPINLI